MIDRASSGVRHCSSSDSAISRRSTLSSALSSASAISLRSWPICSGAPVTLTSLSLTLTSLSHSKHIVSQEQKEMSSSGSRGRRRASSSSRRPSHNTGRSTQESQNDEVQGVRGPNIIDIPPTNPNEREMISLTPNIKDFTENVTSTITHMCLSGWPTPAITWKKQTYQHRTHVWEDFTAVNRVKGMMYKARNDAKKDAENAYPGEDPENHIYKFNPPWVAQSIWVEMCQKWANPNWLKKSEQGVKNRASNAPEGSKPMGTYKGGSVSQAKYHDRLASSNGGSISFIELYKRTREGLPKTQDIVDHYNRLMDEKYP